MTQARYFVVQHDDVWMIKFDDEEYGPYKSKNEAMLFAIDAAQKLGEHGEGAEVVLMGENDHARPEWAANRHCFALWAEDNPWSGQPWLPEPGYRPGRQKYPASA